MISDDLPLSRASVDRTAVARADDELIRRARADGRTRVLLVRDGSVVMRTPSGDADPLVGEGWGRRAGGAVRVAFLDPGTAEAVARAADAAPRDAEPADAAPPGTAPAGAAPADPEPADAEPGDGGWLFLGRDDDGDVLARRVRPEHSAPRSGAPSDVLVHRPRRDSGAAADAAIAASSGLTNGTSSSPSTSSGSTSSTVSSSAAHTAPTSPSDVDAEPVPEPLPGLRWVALRAIGAELSDADAGLATTAVALDAWHARHPRCPRCGAPTTSTAAGWTRRCTVDGSEHYPRTDPAVIMAVVDDSDRLLLGHAAAWAPHRFSTLAGFVEAGESVEHAVRREVAEETTVLVGDVAYAGSQPWPFPASLMLGFRARALSTDVVVDGVELTEARWFSRDELAAAVATGDLVLPSPASIAHALIEDWYGAPVPTSD